MAPHGVHLLYLDPSGEIERLRAENAELREAIENGGAGRILEHEFKRSKRLRIDLAQSHAAEQATAITMRNVQLWADYWANIIARNDSADAFKRAATDVRTLLSGKLLGDCP